MSINIKKFFSYCYIALITFMYGFYFTNLNFEGSVHDALLALAILSAFISIIIDKYYTESFFKLAVVASLGLLVYISSGETLLVLMLLLALMIKNVNYHSAFSLIFLIRFIMFIIVILCVMVGYLDVGKITVSKGIYGTFNGYGLGYNHPNNFAQEIFYLSTLYLCIKNENIKSIELFFLLIIDCITYMITGSKTVCILFLLLILLLYLYKTYNNSNIYKLYSKFSLYSSLVLPTMSIIFPILFIHSTGKIRNFLYLLNGKLNQRLSNSTMLFYSFPVTLFGKIIDLDYLKRRYGYNVVDNGYTFLLFNFGIVGYILIIYLYYSTMKILIQKKQIVYFSVVLMMLCLAIMENVLRAPFMNFCMIFWWESLSESLSKFKKYGGKNDR